MLLNVLSRFTRQMAIPTLDRLRSPFCLRWWEWAKIAGIIGFAVLAILLATGSVPHPAVAAVLLHLALDFSLQSSETSLRKGERGRCLLVHALAAGGLPLAVMGIVAGDPAAVLAWALVGAVSHYAVDWTHKFGLRREALAVFADQACHLLTILILAWLR